jgi:hypothetical protein
MYLMQGRVHEARIELEQAYNVAIKCSSAVMVQHAAMNMGLLCIAEGHQTELAAQYFRYALDFGATTDAGVRRTCIDELHKLYTFEGNGLAIDALASETQRHQKPKHVIFVLDVSGSMNFGQFIEVSVATGHVTFERYTRQDRYSSRCKLSSVRC